MSAAAISSLSLAAQAALVVSTSAGTFATAQLIGAGSFTSNALADVFDSTTIKHVEILQTGSQSAGYGYYRFTHGGGTMHLDIDTLGLTSGRFDTEIGIFPPDDVGGSSTGTVDSLLFNLNLAAGDYVVGVCALNCFFAKGGVITGGEIQVGDRYTLNISSGDAVTVPEPGALSLVLLAALGAFASRRRAK